MEYTLTVSDDALLEEIVGGDALSVSALGELLESRRGMLAAGPDACGSWGLER